MKFHQVREMRTHYGKVLEDLRKEKKIVLMSKGKPVALLTELTEDSFEERIAETKSTHFAAEPSLLYGTEDPEILKAWIGEAESRRRDYLEGKSKLIPAKKVFASLRQKTK